MSDFLASIFDLCERELQTALDEHSSSYPGGDWKAANERIGKIRAVADAALHAGGQWPSSERYLGNDAVLKLLRSNKVG